MLAMTARKQAHHVPVNGQNRHNYTFIGLSAPSLVSTPSQARNRPKALVIFGSQSPLSCRDRAELWPQNPS